MREILNYIIEKYDPCGVIVYGSFADGTNTAYSDFDALAIADTAQITHDNSIICGTELDLFVYPLRAVEGKADQGDFAQLYDGKVVLDTNGNAVKLLLAVRRFLDSKPKKTQRENQVSLEWCEKMLHRAQRNDAEGFYRWHWLLTDSLEIYFDVMGRQYFGSKKSIGILRDTDARGYALYEDALKSFAYDSLCKWIGYLREVFEKQSLS